MEQFPSDALALLLRGMGLLEKALNLSPTEEASSPLRHAFGRMLEAAEVASVALSRAPATVVSPRGDIAKHPPGRPNLIIFEFALQQVREAAVALSKGREEGGWEAFCREKLSLALLLLDLLGSEADGEDLPLLAAYTKPITRIMSEIDRLVRLPPEDIARCGRWSPAGRSPCASVASAG